MVVLVMSDQTRKKFLRQLKHRNLLAIWVWVLIGKQICYLHQGESFKQLVRSTKELLQKQLQNFLVNYEELQTILCEVELKLNNRSIR